MPREIKFRAWDKTIKMWITGLLVFDGQGKVYLRDPNTNVITEYHQLFNSLEVVWYTGLKDKNDKEIYEGDILRCESNYIRLQTNEQTGKKSIKFYEVVWHEVMFTTKRIDNGHINPLVTSPSIWKNYYEVIGNIYENPGLLK